MGTHRVAILILKPNLTLTVTLTLTLLIVLSYSWQKSLTIYCIRKRLGRIRADNFANCLENLENSFTGRTGSNFAVT